MNWFRIWRLKRALRGARLLHANGNLDDAQYGAFAVYVVERLKKNGAPMRLRDLQGIDCGWVSFPLHAADALKQKNEQWPNIDFESSLAMYGPYNQASVWIQSAIENLPGFKRHESSFTWDRNAGELLKDALFKLSGWQRAAIHMEDWIVERKKRLPNVLGMVGKILLIIATAAVSFAVGRLSK